MLTLVIIGIALSMDTFSLSLSLGTLNIRKKSLLKYNILVGLLHFIFPIIGNHIGSSLFSFLSYSSNKILGFIFLILFIKLSYDLIRKQELSKTINSLTLILLAISVSLDSFTTGLGLKAVTNLILLPALIFSILSSLFTLLGIIIGKKANKNLGNIANYFGLILLLLLSISHLCK